MKKIIFIVLLLPMFTFGQSWKTSREYSKWTDEIKDDYLKECIDNAGRDIAYNKRENYCICSLGRLMEQHTDPEKAVEMIISMTTEQLMDYIMPCVYFAE